MSSQVCRHRFVRVTRAIHTTSSHPCLPIPQYDRHATRTIQHCYGPASAFPQQVATSLAASVLMTPSPTTAHPRRLAPCQASCTHTLIRPRHAHCASAASVGGITYCNPSAWRLRNAVAAHLGQGTIQPTRSSISTRITPARQQWSAFEALILLPVITV